MDLSQQTRAIVSRHDPALDRSKMDVEKYVKTRDPRLVVTMPGAPDPRWFDVKRLDRSEYEAVNGLPLAHRISGLIVFGLVRVRQGATTIEPTREIQRTGRAEMRRVWNEEPGGELDALYDSMPFKTWLEVADVIEAMAGMQPGEATGSCDERFSQLR